MSQTKQFLRFPDPPSWIDRLIVSIDHLPGPDWLFYVVAVLAVWVVINAALWIDGSMPIGTGAGIPGIFPPLVFYYLALYHHLTRYGSRSLERFRPLIGKEDTEVSRIDHQLTILPQWLGWLGVAMGLRFTPPYVLGDRLAFGNLVPQTPLPVVVALLTAGFVGATFFCLIARSIRQLRTVHRLHAQATKLSLLNLEPTHAFAALTARTAIGVILVMPIGYLYFPAAASSPWILLAYVLMAALALVIFLAPILGMRDRLQQEKARALKKTGDLLDMTLREVHRKVEQGNWEELKGMETATATLTREREMLEKVSIWPWNTATIRGFATTLLLPIVLWIVTSLRPPNNSLGPTWPARILEWRSILAMGWLGGSARGR